MKPSRLLPSLLALLMLLLALLPAAGRAAAALAGGDWVEICSAQGLRRVNLKTGGESPDLAQAQPCGLCQLQAQALGLPPAPSRWQLPERFAEAPAAFLQAPRLLAVWRHALSRGPPPVSVV